jgi:hypothetical protein
MHSNGSVGGMLAMMEMINQVLSIGIPMSVVDRAESNSQVFYEEYIANVNH